MTEISLPSPAKINLFLHVVGRRTDGYHLLQTAFQFLDFCDEMLFILRSDGKIKLDTQNVNIATKDNLVFKAATLLQSYTGVKQGANISLDKRIPLGGGLGGGSSNAATTLLALNFLWQTELSQKELAKLALSLGADVPIFIHGKASFAEGVGEILTTIAPPEDWILLLLPDCAANTQKIFSDSQLTRNTRTITITEFLESGGHNDCEPIARKLFPKIAVALDNLNQHVRARMSGTGSSVFASFKNKEAATEVARKIPVAIERMITKGLNLSPLHSALNSKCSASRMETSIYGHL
jgi:4-diphosphocytidyl-2-C-methyl-D-erythritol kinase